MGQVQELMEKEMQEYLDAKNKEVFFVWKGQTLLNSSFLPGLDSRMELF